MKKNSPPAGELFFISYLPEADSRFGVAETVDGVYETDGTGFVAEDQGRGSCAAAEVADASQHGTVGDGCFGEDAVVAFD